MDMRDFARMIASDGQENSAPKLAPDVEATILRDALALLNVRHELPVGTVVRQKLGCKSYAPCGSDNDLAIVVEHLDQPLVETGDSASQYYKVPMDMIVGRWAPANGTFNIYHVDSRRWEPYAAPS